MLEILILTHSEHMHYITKWRIRHTQLLSMRHTHPLLRNCQDNVKLACHCTVHYKMEWIYGGSLELAQETRKKKIDKWLFFEHLILACTIVFEE